MSEIPLDEAPRDVSAAAHDAARGKVVYLTEHGQRLAAIVPAELAAELEHLTPEAFRELLEDFADAEAARQALAEGGEPVPWEQVKAELEAEAGTGSEAEAEARVDLGGSCEEDVFAKPTCKNVNVGEVASSGSVEQGE